MSYAIIDSLFSTVKQLDLNIDGVFCYISLSQIKETGMRSGMKNANRALSIGICFESAARTQPICARSACRSSLETGHTREPECSRARSISSPARAVSPSSMANFARA